MCLGSISPRKVSLLSNYITIYIYILFSFQCNRVAIVDQTNIKRVRESGMTSPVLSNDTHNIERRNSCKRELKSTRSRHSYRVSPSDQKECHRYINMYQKDICTIDLETNNLISISHHPPKRKHLAAITN